MCILYILTGWLKLLVAVAVVSSLEAARRRCEDPLCSALFSQGTEQKENIINITMGLLIFSRSGFQPFWLATL